MLARPAVPQGALKLEDLADTKPSTPSLEEPRTRLGLIELWIGAPDFKPDGRARSAVGGIAHVRKSSYVLTISSKSMTNDAYLLSKVSDSVRHFSASMSPRNGRQSGDLLGITSITTK
jgi:hypothetical protein